MPKANLGAIFSSFGAYTSVTQKAMSAAMLPRKDAKSEPRIQPSAERMNEIIAPRTTKIALRIDVIIAIAISLFLSVDYPAVRINQ